MTRNRLSVVVGTFALTIGLSLAHATPSTSPVAITDGSQTADAPPPESGAERTLAASRKIGKVQISLDASGRIGVVSSEKGTVTYLYEGSDTTTPDRVAVHRFGSAESVMSWDEFNRRSGIQLKSLSPEQEDDEYWRLVGEFEDFFYGAFFWTIDDWIWNQAKDPQKQCNLDACKDLCGIASDGAGIACLGYGAGIAILNVGIGGISALACLVGAWGASSSCIARCRTYCK